MSVKARNRHKETATTVFSGTIVNYPLHILVLWLLLDVWQIEDAFWLATYSTMIMTVFAYIRVYLVRAYFDKQ